MTNGTIKTTKNVLYPYTIKTLTNRTELINLTNRLGHGISYSMLEEMETENAYRVLWMKRESSVLPKECEDQVFRVMIADNIDCNEETLVVK